MAATSSSVAKPLTSDNLISSSNSSSGETAGHFVLAQQLQATLQFLFINSSVKRFYNPILQSLKIGRLYATNGSDASVLKDVSLF